MAKQTINVGTNQDDGTGDLLRAAFLKVNENFTEVYTEMGGESLSNIKLSGSTISTDTSNSNLILNPNGTGEIQLTGVTAITGNTAITGTLSASAATTLSSTLGVTGTSTLAALDATNVTASGTLGVTGTSTLGVINVSGISEFTNTTTFSGLLSATGSVDLGNASADTITTTGRFDSSLVPSTNSANDLGSSSLRWATIYGTTLDVTSLSVGSTVMDTISIAGNKISSNASNANIELDPSGTGQVDIRSNVTLNGNTLTGNVTGNVTGNITSSGTSIFTTADINGGTIDATTVGATVPSTGKFTQVLVDNLSVDGATVQTTVGQLFLASAASGINVSANIITNLGTPVGSTDAATKAYVDASTSLNIVDDSSTLNVIDNGEALQILGGTNITTSLSADVLTITGAASQDLGSVTAVGAATTDTITVGGVITDGIKIDDNVITTTRSNDNLELSPNGTGSVDVRNSLIVENIKIDGNTISSTAGTDLLITPLAGQQIVLDGAIIIDAGVVTGATSITSTALVGTTLSVSGLTNLTGSFTQAIHTFVATDAITSAEHAGRILLLGEVGGNADVVLTLPDATGSGNIYEFIISVTMASNTYKIQCPDASNVINGTMQNMDLDGTAVTIFSTVAASDTITLNGGTQGGQVGDTLRLIDMAADLWHVSGIQRTPAGANPATPFSAAVS